MGWKTLVVTLALLAPLAQVSGASDAPSIPPFLLSFAVDAPGAPAANLTLGVDPAASVGYDHGLDRPVPPPPPDAPYASAYLREADVGERLARSLEGPAPSAEWTLHVDASGPAGVVRVAWDPAQLDALPLRFVVEAEWGNATHDMRDESSVALAKPAGAASLAIPLHARRLEGETPSAPQNPAADVVLHPGHANVSWDAPVSDGGHPVRGYVVYRADNGSAFREVARVKATFVDDGGLAVGGSYRYAIAAVNRLGVGNASVPVDATPTGKPGAFAPEPGEDERPLADADAPVPSRSVDTPEVQVLRVDAGPSVDDDHEWSLGVTTLGRSNEAVVYTPVAGPWVHSPDVTAPAQHAGTPEAHANAGAGATQQGVVLRTYARAGPAAWDDATELP